MPARSPFTQLCLSIARQRRGSRVDLHCHTTASDGLYTPEQIVDIACRSGMPALAITDHDTTAALETARAAAGDRLQIISGVEITTEFEGRELHLLGYFFDPSNAAMSAALGEICTGRLDRFYAMAERLRESKIHLSDEGLRESAAATSVGRRHLASLLVRERHVRDIREAFARYLGDGGRAYVAKRRLGIADAIALVRNAGGLTAWAHPGAECTEISLKSLYNLGMRALEVEWPTCKPSRSRLLRRMAKEIGLAPTAGSDCHGPGEPRRSLGACGVSVDELSRLQGVAHVLTT